MDCKPVNTILHLIDTTGPGGAETVFIALADLLRERGCESIVVIKGPGWVNDTLRVRGISPYIVPADGSFAIGFLAKLVSIIRKHKVDVIQSHLLGSNVYAAIAGLLTNTPVVATYHGMVDVDPKERFRALKHAAMRWGIKRYVAVSDRLMRNIRDQDLLDPQKSSVIYNGVEISRYGKQSSLPVRKQLSLAENAILIGSLGNIRPAKAYDVLIAAGAEVIKQNPDVHFVIAGHQKSSLMETLNLQMKNLGVSGHFHFLGFCENCAEFLGQMDVFALSSSSEGFSIATIEAMASGVPVVVTKCGGPEEIVTPEQNGLMVPVGDPTALAGALLRLVQDKTLSDRLAEAGRVHVVNTFSIDKMLDEYQRLYLIAQSS